MSSEIAKGCLTHHDSRHLQVRRDFLGLCDYKAEYTGSRKEEPNQECMAKILRLLETLTDHQRTSWYVEALKAKERKQPIPPEPDSYPLELTNGVLVALMFDTFAECTVRKSLNYLEELRYVSRVQAHKNIAPHMWLNLPILRDLLDIQEIEGKAGYIFRPRPLPDLPVSGYKNRPQGIKIDAEGLKIYPWGYKFIPNNISNKKRVISPAEEEGTTLSVAPTAPASTTLPIVNPTIPAAAAASSILCGYCGIALRVIENRVFPCECQSETVRLAAIRPLAGVEVGVGSPMATRKIEDEAESDASRLGASQDASLRKVENDTIGGRELPSSLTGMMQEDALPGVSTGNALPGGPIVERLPEPGEQSSLSIKTFQTEKDKIPLDEQGFSPQGRAVYEAWCEIMFMSVPIVRKTAAVANTIAPTLLVLAGLLGLTLAQTMNDLNTWVYASDEQKVAQGGKSYYRGRGVKLHDLEHEIEGWVSEKRRILAANERAASGAPLPPKVYSNGLRRFTAEELAPRSRAAS